MYQGILVSWEQVHNEITLQETSISHLEKKENHQSTQKCRLGKGYVSLLEGTHFSTTSPTSPWNIPQTLKNYCL